ncbi:MAG: beta-ketoacyl-ACP synthase II [Kiritimatiellae bacterium]|nr:beta-ketoacyl-ACP synthase II [Kiritimatiellia bacterium]
MAERIKVVVTGLGAVTPVGNNVPDTWAALLAGRSGIAPITRFDSTPFATHFAGEIKNLNLEDYIPRKEIRKMDPFTHWGLIAAREAIADSGLDMAAEDSWRVGVIASSGIGGLQVLQSQWGKYTETHQVRFSPFMIPQMITNILPGYIAIEHHCQGPNFAVVSACSTATHSLGVALDTIRAGRADVMIAGGAEGAVCELGIGGFNALRALSTRNDDPATASRPFDATRDGFVLSEGAGILVLESEAHALARGARIYCELAGFGATDDAHHITAPLEDGAGASMGMTLAMRDAGLAPSDIDYINAHGTSTALNDAGETTAIKTALGEDDARRVAISSTKSMTGHMLGATGSVESIVCALAIRDSVIPPTINYANPDPACDLDYTPNHSRPLTIRAALNNNLGFGGHNATLAFKAYPYNP